MIKTPNRKQAVGYIRVSTEEQAREGVSLDAQRAKIKQWCELHGFSLIEIYEDAGISGAKLDRRPGANAAIDAACKHRAAVVFFSLSRLSRSVRDTLNIAEKLDKSGADLVSISESIDTTNAAGRMVFRMLAVFAEFERDQTSERVKLALDRLCAQGKRTSYHAPFGQRLVGDELHINHREQDILERMIRLKKRGRGYREVADLLNKHRYFNRAGSPWKYQDVWKRIQNEAKLRGLDFRLTPEQRKAASLHALRASKRSGGRISQG